MDIVTLGAALNGSAEYVNSHFKGGSNIQIVNNPDGTQTINASGEVSSEDTVARADIAAIKDGETLDSFGDVETALATKADSSTTYTKTEVDTALSAKQNTISDLSTIRSGAALGATAVQPETGKGLSTNDYTTSEKTKLAGVAEGAEVNEIDGIKVNNTTINPDANKVVNITVPTTAADISALPASTKYAAALSLTINSSTFVMTGQLKDQNGDNIGTAQTIDLPLESVVVGGSYDSQTQKIVLTLQNGNTVEFSVADLVSGLQTELSENNKLNPAYINYDSTHRAVSDTEKSTWDGKQNALNSAQLDAVNSGIDSTKVEQIETNKTNILSILGNFETLKDAIGLQQNTDLNNLSEVGTYYSSAGYSLNAPTTSPFRAIVRYDANNPNHIEQEINVWRTAEKYKRWTTNTAEPRIWSDWVLVNDDLSALENFLSYRLPVTITSQPSDSAVSSGEQAYFHVEVSAVRPTYQWYLSSDGGTTWSTTGATGNKTDTLTPIAQTSYNERKYKCIITDLAGNTVESNAATLIVSS